MTATCKTCRSWDTSWLGDVCWIPQDDGVYYGECKHEAMNLLHATRNGIHLINVDRDHRLLYGEDFNCIHHEPKEINAKTM